MFKPGDAVIVFDEHMGEKLREAKVERVSQPDNLYASLWLEGDIGPAEWNARGWRRRSDWGQRLLTQEGYEAAIRAAEAERDHRAFVDEALPLLRSDGINYGNSRDEVIARVTIARDRINAWLEKVNGSAHE